MRKTQKPARPGIEPWHIDPGAEADTIFGLIEGTNVEAILLTHGHDDHTMALDEVKERTGAPIYLHPIEAAHFEISYDIPIQNDQLIPIGNLNIKVIHTPGHTYGMQGVLVKAKTKKYFIASDTFGFFENLKKEPPLISGIYVDLAKYYESIEKIDSLSAHILPGHDFGVFDREAYY